MYTVDRFFSIIHIVSAECHLIPSGTIFSLDRPYQIKAEHKHGRAEKVLSLTNFDHGSFLFIYSNFCFQIGCSKVIYLFDVLTLGAPCFDEGLQDILESGDILKVLIKNQ